MTSSRRLAALIGGVVLLLFLGMTVLFLLRSSADLEVDTEWMEEIVEHRAPGWEGPSLVFDFLGGHWFAIFVVPLGVAAILFVARRRWSALVFLVGCGVSAAIVQLVKVGVGRPRPEDILIDIDSGSFPSGHTANAATVVVLLALLLQRWWIWAAGAVYVVLMALSRTYLGAHWVSDTVGGALLGGGVAVLVWATFAAVLRSERVRRRVAASPDTSLDPTLAPPPVAGSATKYDGAERS